MMISKFKASSMHLLIHKEDEVEKINPSFILWQLDENFFRLS